MNNPWGLSESQALAMQAYIENGTEKGAAYALNKNFRTVSTHIGRAMERMDARNRLHAALTWDRWERAGAPVPAPLELLTWRPV